MPGGAVRSAQTRPRSRAPSATATPSLGTHDRYALGAASSFGFGAIVTFALDSIWSLILTAAPAEITKTPEIGCASAIRVVNAANSKQST